MTNPLPDWYTSAVLQPGEGVVGLEDLRRRADDPVGYERDRLALRAARDAATVAASARTGVRPREPRGPLTLRLRLWWMRLWLPR